MTQAWTPKVAQGFDQLAWRGALRTHPLAYLGTCDWLSIAHYRLNDQAAFLCWRMAA